MGRAKNPDLVKKTLFLHEGDFEKMGEIFTQKPASEAIRDLVRAFVREHYTAASDITIPPVTENL